MMILNAKALAEARKKKSLTQLDLSEATKPQINVSTISRLERGKSVKVQEKTVRELARALGVTVASLCSTEEPDRDVVKMNLNAVARNALTLVSQRYRIHRERIVELAPLLFFVAAEQSLRDRQKRVEELREAADAMIGLQSQIQHLPRHWPLDEGSVSSEEKSIAARDLFAARVLEDADQFLGDLDDDFDEAEHNPFVGYLRSVLASAGASEDEVGSVRWSPGLWLHYQICTEQAGRIVGNDTDAVHAILSGAAALHEMPKASPEERAAWAVAERRRKFGDLDDFLEDVMARASGDDAKGDIGSDGEAAP